MSKSKKVSCSNLLRSIIISASVLIISVNFDLYGQSETKQTNPYFFVGENGKVSIKYANDLSQLPKPNIIEGNTPVFSIPTVNTVPYSYVTMTVSFAIPWQDGITALQAYIRFNSSELDIVSMTVNNTIDVIYNAYYDNSQGYMAVVIISQSGLPLQNNSVTVRINVSNFEGLSDVYFDTSNTYTYDFNGNYILPIFENGGINTGPLQGFTALEHLRSIENNLDSTNPEVWKLFRKVFKLFKKGKVIKAMDLMRNKLFPLIPASYQSEVNSILEQIELHNNESARLSLISVDSITGSPDFETLLPDFIPEGIYLSTQSKVNQVTRLGNLPSRVINLGISPPTVNNAESMDDYYYEYDDYVGYKGSYEVSFLPIKAGPYMVNVLLEDGMQVTFGVLAGTMVPLADKILYAQEGQERKIKRAKVVELWFGERVDLNMNDIFYFNDPDLILIDNGDAKLKSILAYFWAFRYLLFPRHYFVKNLEQAANNIFEIFDQSPGRLFLVIDGHGVNGIACVGNGEGNIYATKNKVLWWDAFEIGDDGQYRIKTVERINSSGESEGGKKLMMANHDFVIDAKNKIYRLRFFGCNIAKDDEKGNVVVLQGTILLEGLANEINITNGVTAYDGIIYHSLGRKFILASTREITKYPR